MYMFARRLAASAQIESQCLTGLTRYKACNPRLFGVLALNSDRERGSMYMSRRIRCGAVYFQVLSQYEAV